MKRLTKGFLSFIMMTSYALGMSAQDATFVPADEIPSSLRDAASLKLTGTWGTSAFAELKMALGTNAIGGSNMVLTRVDMGEAEWGVQQLQGSERSGDARCGRGGSFGFYGKGFC